MTEEKTIIRPKVESMSQTKSASGSTTHSKGDFVSDTLEAWPLYNVRNLATSIGIDVSKYDHLNPGHQRMILGNMFRKRINDREKLDEGSGAEWFGAIAANHAPEFEEEVVGSKEAAA
jgi:hypothetical protein